MKPLLSLLVLVLPLVPGSVAAELSLGSLFQDHAVLQREMAVPVWGSAEAGQTVDVEFAGQSKQTTADNQGKWSVRLDAMPVNGELQIRDYQPREARDPADTERAA